MPTLIYSPGIRVLIDTEGHGIVDVSEDVSNFSLTLTEDQVSKFRCDLLNHRRKYDGVFTPNDRIHVQLKRINWVPVFSGYLDQVPLASLQPRTVNLSASCTLKRLQHTYWDSSSMASNELMLGVGTGGGSTDGGMRDRLVTLLTNVAGWPEDNIHIGSIPSTWVEQTRDLQRLVGAQLGGTSGLVHGQNPLTAGVLQVESNLPGTGVLPLENGRGRIQAVGQISTTLEISGEAAGEGARSGRRYQDPWYLHMRFPYRTADGDGVDGMGRAEVEFAKLWWKEKKILVVNPANNRAVVLRPAHWGPPSTTATDLGVSQQALDWLKAARGHTMEVRFVADDTPLGEVNRDLIEAEEAGTEAVDQSTVPSQIVTEDGLVFIRKDNLQPNVYAAREFVKQNWGDRLHGISGYGSRPIGSKSDHPKGLALDFMIAPGGKEPTPAQIATGNEIARWFMENPNVFGTNQVIWMDRTTRGRGWAPYKHAQATMVNGRATNPTLGHRDHPHIGFKSGWPRQAGPMGDPWPGHDDPLLNRTAGFVNPIVNAGSGFGPFSGSGPSLINMGDWWTFSQSSLSDSLTGHRRLLNDKPLYPTILSLARASLRSHMSAPNGDFIAWFPDYFGTFGTAGKMVIQDLEILQPGYQIVWSDRNLVTHQFTAGAWHGWSDEAITGSPGGQFDRVINPLMTMGVASVDFPEILEALFNVDVDDPRAELFRDPEKILQRHGIRVDYRPLDTITGPEAEFWFAIHLFQKAWASQFSSSVSTTFLPEVWPGMLVQFESAGLQAYVVGVTHSGNMSGSGGPAFTTTLNVIAPSATDGSGLVGLPRAGGNNRKPPKVTVPSTGGGVRII